MALEDPPFQIDFLQLHTLQEAAAKVAQEINGVAVRCNVMQDADGEHDEKSHLDFWGA